MTESEVLTFLLDTSVLSEGAPATPRWQGHSAFHC